MGYNKQALDITASHDPQHLHSHHTITNRETHPSHQHQRCRAISLFPALNALYMQRASRFAVDLSGLTPSRLCLFLVLCLTLPCCLCRHLSTVLCRNPSVMLCLPCRIRMLCVAWWTSSGADAKDAKDAMDCWCGIVWACCVVLCFIVKDLHGLGGRDGSGGSIALEPLLSECCVGEIGGCSVAVFEHYAEGFVLYLCRKMWVCVLNRRLDDAGSVVGGIITR
jgi:hypothetical protein